MAPPRADLEDRGRGLGDQRQRGPTKPKDANYRPPTYGAKQDVKGGVEKRARRRLKALDGVAGVNAKDGLTGREARRIRRAWLRKGRPTVGGGGNAGRPNRPARPGDLLSQQVNAQTRLQFGGQQQQLDYERRLSQQHQANLGGWYQNYLNTVQQAAGQQAANTAALQGAAYGQANTAAGADQAANAQLLAQQQADAAQRGMTVDPSLAQNAQAGVAARQAQGSQFGGLVAAQGNAQTGYLQNRVGIAAGEGVQAQQDEQRKRMQIEKFAMDLKKDIGAYKVDARRKLKDEAWETALEAKTFDLKATGLAADIADDQADNRRADKAERRQQRSQRQTAARNRLLNAQTRENIRSSKGKRELDRQADLADNGRRDFSTNYSEWAQRTRPNKNGDGGGSGAGPDGKYTQSQINASQKDFRRARRLGQGISPGAGEYGEAIDFLSDEKEIDPLIARAAVAPWTLTKRQRQELRRMGIKINSTPRRNSGPTPYSGPRTN